MAIHFVMNITISREPAECTPGREPGWYVKDRAQIVAYVDTEKEAIETAQKLQNLGE